MLTPDQVIPFLQNDDVEVRQHAVLYLTGAHDPSPATAEDFWRAIDMVGPENAISFTERLELLPQTDESVRRTLEGLTAFPPDHRQGLLRVLRSLDIETARKHRDAIGAAEHVPPDVVQHLDQRLALAAEPPEPLWDRLMAQAAALEDKELTEEDALAAERVIEALARRPDVAADRAVAMLRDQSVRGWREVVVADLAGEMRLRTPEAVEALIDKLKDEETDILWETASEALVRAGDARVVERLAERFPRENWGFKISAAGVLGRIKLPQAEAALVRLLPGETDKEVVTFLAASLLDLCPTDVDVLRSVRQVILDQRYEPGTTDLKAMLVAVGRMSDYVPEEAADWEAERAADRKRWESGAADADGILAAITSRRLGAEDLGPVGQILGIPDSRPLAPLRPATRSRRETPGRRGASSYAPAQQIPSLRREKAKVGRNDPCPCGSGKKFKKCCNRD